MSVASKRRGSRKALRFGLSGWNRGALCTKVGGCERGRFGACKVGMPAGYTFFLLAQGSSAQCGGNAPGSPIIGQHWVGPRLYSPFPALPLSHLGAGESPMGFGSQVPSAPSSHACRHPRASTSAPPCSPRGHSLLASCCLCIFNPLNTVYSLISLAPCRACPLCERRQGANAG